MRVGAFPACGMGVYAATDAALCGTEVFAAALSALQIHACSAHGQGHRSSISSAGHGSVYSSSHGHGYGKERKHAKPKTRTWEDRPVLLLLGYKTIKVRFFSIVFVMWAGDGERCAPTRRFGG
jgi:hypothetical protein